MFKLKTLALLAALILSPVGLTSTKTFAVASSTDSAKVAKKGTLRLRLPAWPKSLNVLTSSDAYLGMLSSFVHSSLVERNQENWEIIPAVAEKWEESSDRKTYTFYLNPKAKFDSGSPVTAEDVKFTFDKLYDKKQCVTCEGTRAYVGKINSIKVEGKNKITFVMAEAHFQNLERIGGVTIFEKKKFEKGNFNKKYDRTLEGAGPYKYNKSKSKFRKSIVLELNKDHWIFDYPYFKNRFNFQKIIFKYIQDDTVAFEAFKKKDLDIFYFGDGTYKFWDNQNAAPFTDKNLTRLKAPKVIPWVWSGVALNMRKGPTSDVRFRKALQLVLNREVFIKKIFNDHQAMVAGPFAAGSDYSSNTKAIGYDPKQASKLIKEAGFTKIDSDGVLYREVKGQKERAEITIMYASKAHDQWMTMFKADAKKIGINVTPRYIDWSAGIKLVDELNFEGFVIGWSGDPTPAPRQLWHGSTANNKGTSNIPGLNDPSIDALIDSAPVAFDESKRIRLFKDLEKKIIDHQPYLFRWTQKNHYVAFWKDKVNSTSTPFYKYSGNNLRSIFYQHWHSAK